MSLKIYTQTLNAHTLTHTNTLTYKHTLTHTKTHTLSLTQSYSLTQTHTHTNTRHSYTHKNKHELIQLYKRKPFHKNKSLHKSSIKICKILWHLSYDNISVLDIKFLICTLHWSVLAKLYFNLKIQFIIQCFLCLLFIVTLHIDFFYF